MKLIELINLLRGLPYHPIYLSGPYGYIHIKLQRQPSIEKQYWVDCSYLSDGKRIEKHQGGFRLSTACCLCACILFGEQAVSTPLIEVINQQFKADIKAKPLPRQDISIGVPKCTGRFEC